MLVSKHFKVSFSIFYISVPAYLCVCGGVLATKPDTLFSPLAHMEEERQLPQVVL